MGSKTLCFFFCSCALAVGLFAQPERVQVVSGECLIKQNDTVFTVQVSDRAVLHWEAFSVGSGETASFRLPSSEAAVLNRVTGGSMTEIHGQLLSNGQVYLINPHGIVVGREGFVQVGAFLASTLDCADKEFLSGEKLFFHGESSGAVRVEGTVMATDGDVTLLGNGVKNSGVIEAFDGHIAMGAGQEIVYCPHGDERIQVCLQLPQETKDLESIGIYQLGKLDSVSAELKADGNLYGYAIKSDGWIEAEEFVCLEGEQGFVTHTGSIEGHEVHVLGEHVRLLENARIDVSAPDGGGIVLIGGDDQGKNPEIRNAVSTFVDKNVVISADALEYGNGGKVVMWAEDATGFLGKANVRGGPQGGDGGLVEVSSRGALDPRGDVDATALFGNTGTMLIDPTNITITTAADSGAVVFAACPAGTYTVSGNATLNISNATLATRLASTCNISISTASAGTQTGTVVISAPITWASVRSLSITANNALSTTTAGTSGTISSTGGGSLTLISGTTMTLGETITVSGGGNITLTAGTTFTSTGAISWSGTTAGTSTLTANGAMTLNASVTNSTTAGNLTFSNAVTTNGTLTVGAASTVSHTSAGTLTFTVGAGTTGTADLTVNGIISVSGTANLTVNGRDDFTVAASPAKIDFLSTGAFNATTVTSTSNITFTGPVTIQGSANIVSANVIMLDGNFTTSGTGAISLTSQAGTATSAATGVILHGSTGNFTMTAIPDTGGVNGDITLSGTFTATSGNVTFAPNDTFTLTAGATLNFSAAGKTLLFQSGLATAHTFSGTVNVTAGNMTINALNDVTISATPGILNYNVPGGTLAITATGGADPDFIMNGTVNILNGTFTVATFDDITFGAGSNFTYSSSDPLTFSATGTTGAIVLSGTATISNGAVTMNARTAITTSLGGVTTYTSPSPWTMTGTTGVITLSGIVNLTTAASWTMSCGGALVINNLVRNFSTGAISATCGGGCTIGFNTNTTQAQFGSAGGMTSLSIGSNLVIVSSETTAGATSTVGFVSGGQNGALNASVGGSTFIESNRAQDAGIQCSGALTVVSNQDLTLVSDLFTGATGKAFIQTTGTGKMILVVDQQAPLPPQIGAGKFNLMQNTFLSTNGGDLSIFTATPAQNLVFGTINGATLSQGTQVFGVWYSQGGNDPPPFTIFYKTGGSSIFGQFNVAIAEIIQEYFDRSMGWTWLGDFWICRREAVRPEEHQLFYRKPFEYPLYDEPPIAPCLEEIPQ